MPLEQTYNTGKPLPYDRADFAATMDLAINSISLDTRRKAAELIYRMGRIDAMVAEIERMNELSSTFRRMAENGKV